MRIIKQSAVIDRIVDNTTAVLLLGEEQAQFLCPVDRLPQGSAEGMWLAVEIKDGRLIRAEVDFEKNREMQNRIRAKLALLRKRILPRR